ncbi:MAG: bacteriocin transport accessory protein [Lachnospiraceae bacterium]|nr:bacteriocin transport accessory protein [Lachnospiraceae bacterium]
MKKFTAIFLAALMALSFAACGSKTTEEKVSITDSLELLTTVIGGYDEADLFPVCGGDSANLNFEGPGKFDAANAEELDITLGFPTSHSDKIDDAASMMNAMMANNFTAGVYRVTDEKNVETVAADLKDNILARQWMCGMPEKMVVISVGNYVVSAFGLSDALDTFKAEISEAYPSASVLYEEAVI